jgi:dihydroorotate dehydrogenase electron transfer subunit
MDNYSEYKPRTVKILKVVKRSNTIKSLQFHDPPLESALPGQFCMVWVPGVDEIPMSISTDFSKGYAEIVVKAVGEATQGLHKLHEDDLIGVRGPYGNWYKIDKLTNLLLIAGGTGIIPLRRLISEESPKKTITLIMGAKTREELIFRDEFEEFNINMLIATEDGTEGFAGTATELTHKHIQKRKFESILCCGPEMMIYELANIAVSHNIPLQASLERIMKCGIGICGSCELSGYRVCKEGPIFNKEELLDMKGELGKFHRNLTGKKIPINP